MALEFDGEKYSKVSAHQKEWGAKLIAEFKFQGDEHILDLGCGDGALTAQLAELVPRGFALGIDASASMIEAARKHRRDNLEFRLSDINDLDFHEEFNLVFSNATLHWIKDHERLLDNVLRSLTDGGILRFNFAADGNCPNFLAVVRDMMKREPYDKHFATSEWPWFMPSISEYEALLIRFPFTETRVWPEEAPTTFQDQDALAGWVDQPSIVPFLAQIPGEIAKQLRPKAATPARAAAARSGQPPLRARRPSPLSAAPKRLGAAWSGQPW